MSKPQNPLFRLIHDRPIVSFFAVPVIISVGSSWVSRVITAGERGSILGNVFAPKEELSPMAGIGNVRTEGGDSLDLMFRAKASSAPTKRGTAVGDEVQPRTTGGPVRYDRNYHDSVFFPNLDYKDNKQVVSQSYPAKVSDTYVFAGINGINKINMR